MRILIVEDEGFLANLYQSLLEKHGHTVYVEPEGEQALYRMRQWKPDIVLLDLKMPKKDGFEVLEERMTDDELKTIPVIVLSALENKDLQHRLNVLNVQGYMHKTEMDIDSLLEKITSLVPEN